MTSNRLDEFRRLAREDPSEVTWFGLGQACIAEGLHAEAEEAFRAAVGCKPDYAAAYLRLGQALAAQEKREEAVKILEEGIRVAARTGDVIPGKRMQALLGRVRGAGPEAGDRAGPGGGPGGGPKRLREVRPGVFQWSRYSEEKGLDFNGHLVVAGLDRVLIDPPGMTPEVEREIRQAPIACILLTNKDHVRDTERLRGIVAAPVRIHERDASLVSIRIDSPFRDGERLAGGLIAVPVPGGKSPGETALFLERDGGTLILGDALIGKPTGTLRFLPPAKFPDFAQARAGVRTLLDRDFAAVLVGDGGSILEGARFAVERALQEE